MAELDMVKKIFGYEDPDYKKIIRHVIYDNGLATYSNGWQNGGVTNPNRVQKSNTATTILPIMYGATNLLAIKLFYDSDYKNTKFRLVRPGYIYRVHFKNDYESNRPYKILVCKDNFSGNSGIFEYYSSKSEGSSTNSHGGAMVHIAPGQNTYVMVLTGGLKAGEEEVYYVPTYGETISGGINSLISSNNVPSVIKKPYDDIESYLEIFK